MRFRDIISIKSMTKYGNNRIRYSKNSRHIANYYLDGEINIYPPIGYIKINHKYSSILVDNIHYLLREMKLNELYI